VRGQIAGRKFQKRYNQDIFALYAGASEGVGANNVTYSLDLMLEAREKLLERDEAGPFTAVMSPLQWKQLVLDLKNNHDSFLSDRTSDASLTTSLFNIWGITPFVVSSGIDQSTEIVSAIYGSSAIGWSDFANPIIGKTLETDTATAYVLHHPYDTKIVNDNAIIKVTTQGS
jgi:hypothetical protein